MFCSKTEDQQNNFLSSWKQKMTRLSRKHQETSPLGMQNSTMSFVFAIIKLGCTTFASQTKHCVAAGFVSCPFSVPKATAKQDLQWIMLRLYKSTNNYWTKPFWADLQLPNCHRHRLHHPRQWRIHLQESQQMHQLRLESAVHPWADLERPNCHRLRFHDPR